MSYFSAIKTSFFIFPFLAFLFTIPFILHQYHKYGSINKLRVLIIYSFILYLICVYFLAIFPLPSKNEVILSKDYQLVPFKFILDIFNRCGEYKVILSFIQDSSVYTVLFNILMFMPFGMYLRYYFKCNLKKTVLICFMFSLFLELTQLTGLYFIYSRPYRLFDVDDLMINTLGGLIGYFIVKLFMKFLPSRDIIDLDSLEEGKKVSGLRRFTRFCLDLFLCLLITTLFSFIFDFNAIYISLIIYYVIIPYIFDGKTIGSKFLNMQLVFPNKKLIRLFMRLFLIILYYLVLPLSLGFLYVFLVKNFDISNLFIFIGGVIYVFCASVFYLVNMTFIFRGKILFYDKFLGVKYISTIGLDNDEKML